MKKLNLLLAIMIMATVAVGQSVGINSDGSSPDASAMLDVKSTSKGFLLPRLASSSIEAINSPAEGLMVYDTDLKKHVYYDGTVWKDFDGNTLYQPEVGDYYGGGVVFYIFQSGDPGYVEGETHGLICALIDQNGGERIHWDYHDYLPDIVYIGATGTAIGTGQDNTTAIINELGEGDYAAKVCDNYEVDGYSDWFLPSSDELNLMCQNKATINATAGANGGDSLAEAMYWSSTEYSGSYYQAIRVRFYSICAQFVIDKYNINRVRAVRAF